MVFEVKHVLRESAGKRVYPTGFTRLLIELLDSSIAGRRLIWLCLFGDTHTNPKRQRGILVFLPRWRFEVVKKLGQALTGSEPVPFLHSLFGLVRNQQFVYACDLH